MVWYVIRLPFPSLAGLYGQPTQEPEARTEPLLLHVQQAYLYVHRIHNLPDFPHPAIL